MAKILFIIAPDKFRDEELFVTREVLEKEGHETIVASTKKGRIQGMKGGFEDVNTLISEIDLQGFDTLVLVGGSGMEMLFNDKTVINMARVMYEADKVVAAICIAPVILANAGILKDKKSTVFETDVDLIEKEGAIYMGPGVSVDGKVVTADGPKNAEKFGREIDKLLK